MKFQNLSVKRLFGRVAMGLVLSMSGITIALFLVTKQTAVLLTGGALLLCALVGIFVLTQAFGKRLSQFTADLCQTLDHMIAGNEAPQRPEDSETQLARIGHRLARLYQIMQENRRRVDEERQELQTLVSDISHQVKTPVSNLKMATDTLLEKPMTEAERTDFIRGIRSQTDKLDFLFQALVKTSRLETGVIQLDKKPGRLFDTVAQAMSGIVYAAEKKEIAVSVDCPEDLTVSHDSKWTSEALFNLLDNAVKYTPAGGKITVVSMGPAQAKEALKSCLAVGADQAFLVTDRAFGGSDTLATSYILSCAVKKMEEDQGAPFDFIFCGKQAIDGDTGQVGPSLAQHLGLARVTYAVDCEWNDEHLEVKREYDEGYDILKCPIPALVTVSKPSYEPRYPTIRSKMAAGRAVIGEITAADLEIDLSKAGLKGSPTKVKKTFTPVHNKQGVKIQEETDEQSALKLVQLMTDENLV